MWATRILTLLSSAAVLAGVAVLAVGEDEAAAKTQPSNNPTSGLVVLTVRRDGTDATERFLRSATVYGYNVKFLGEKAEGGAEGGGSTRSIIDLLKEELVTLDEEKLVLFTESVDAILAGGGVRVVEEFEGCKCGVLVSADGFCWPDKTLESQYPKVPRGKRFLNAGGFMGEAGTILNLLTEEETRQAEKDEPAKKNKTTTTKEKQEQKAGGGETETEGLEGAGGEGGGSAGLKALQELFTEAFLHNPTRNKYRIKIDHLASLFQNLNGATGDVELRWVGKEGYLQNTLYNTVPVVIRGNEHSKLNLNTLGSYLARSWNPEEGCRSCWDQMMSLEEKSEAEYPKVTLAVFVEKVTPFMEEFTQKLQDLVYPQSRMDLFVHSNVEYHETALTTWVESIKSKYMSVKLIKVDENVKEWHARNIALDYCVEQGCDFYFSVDSEAHLDNPYTLKLLLEQNRRVVAPMLIRPHKAWSNFWGAITNDGFYARSVDYMEIVSNNRRGLWNVPYISGSYLLKRSLLTDPKTKPSYIRNLLDPDMALCENLREKGVFMYVSNRVDFGHLVNSENFDPTKMNPELWQVMDNRWDWERRYLHPNYSLAVAENTTLEMPCPDVFWFPLFKERYAQEMIATFEDYGVWSDGGNEQQEHQYRDTPPQLSMKTMGMSDVWQQILNIWVAPMAKKIYTGYTQYDARLEGGYESVPTIDIHMKQVGMEAEWLEILRSYIQPVQLKAFEGYYNDIGPPRAVMNFMVRYKPDEQPFLRPHHDTSTYTINVALNKPGVDYEGGGCRFVRYNCSVTDSRVGWVLMHPGRLTHIHEGLPTTAGTRYIIVTFVDP